LNIKYVLENNLILPLPPTVKESSSLQTKDRSQNFPILAFLISIGITNSGNPATKGSRKWEKPGKPY
jgi:hypothetical protein